MSYDIITFRSTKLKKVISKAIVDSEDENPFVDDGDEKSEQHDDDQTYVYLLHSGGTTQYLSVLPRNL